MKYYKFNFDPIILNVLALPVLAIFLLIPLLVLDNFTLFDNYSLEIAIMMIWMILHELIHGLGFVISKNVTTRDITYGMYIEKGIFYCMCKKEITKKDIIRSLLMPLVLIGIVTLILGLILENSLLCFLSVINISGAIGDFIMFLFFLKLPDDILYVDTDDNLGFTVLSSKDISNTKMLGIKFLSSGEFELQKMITDYRKIVISKASWCLIILTLILLVIGLINL